LPGAIGSSATLARGETAQAALHSGDFATARRAYESLLARYWRSMVPDSKGALTVRHNLAVTLAGMGRRDEAR